MRVRWLSGLSVLGLVLVLSLPGVLWCGNECWAGRQLLYNSEFDNYGCWRLGADAPAAPIVSGGCNLLGTEYDHVVYSARAYYRSVIGVEYHGVFRVLPGSSDVTDYVLVQFREIVTGGGSVTIKITSAGVVTKSAGNGSLVASEEDEEGYIWVHALITGVVGGVDVEAKLYGNYIVHTAGRFYRWDYVRLWGNEIGTELSPDADLLGGDGVTEAQGTLLIASMDGVLAGVTAALVSLKAVVGLVVFFLCVGVMRRGRAR